MGVSGPLETTAAVSASPPEHHTDSTGTSPVRKNLLLALGALGVVYGDIGTSPLYSVKECFYGLHAMALTPDNIYGVMSLIFWALFMVVSVKYVLFILKADNHGEGGIYALIALFLSKGRHAVSKKTVNRLTLLAIFGAALLYGDGLITPVISVLSAVEGLETATTTAKPFILPITCGILVALFLVQHLGTERIGRIFGPIMLFWFFTIAALGIAQIVQHPHILTAINPKYAVRFFFQNHLHGVVVLGAVVLCITGGEALYADLGHFGRGPIRISWSALVFPALLLNYFGQTALLLGHPELAANPFYGLVPKVLLYPMVALATMATVIASQAMITGVYSLTQQAIQIGFCPRLRIVHTSHDTRGQIYLPWVNFVMMFGCIGLALIFKESGNLAAAYGIAVTGTMGITTLIYFYVARFNWGWSLPKAVIPVAVFLFFDVAFFGANLLKFVDGGWFTISVAVALSIVMITWRDGRALLRNQFEVSQIPLELITGDIAADKVLRTPSTAVFLSVTPTGTPIALLHLLKHSNALPERILILSMVTAEVPYVSDEGRLEVTPKGHGFHRIVASYGFMETPSIPHILELCAAHGLSLELESVSFYLGREILIPTGDAKMARWRKNLFVFLTRNAWNVSTFFGIPPGRVIELGTQVAL